METSDTLSFFIAGIIQGSKKGRSIYDQSYRDSIRDILTSVFGADNIDVFCPFENHQQSVEYDDEKAKEVFFHHIDKLKSCHALIVYLPEASLGTGIEMWEAFHSGRIVITISPMHTNWVVRLFSDAVCADIDAFRELAASGSLQKILLAQKNRVRTETS